ncbi:14069_t:CDS:2 [Dentiscutata heterogama]|uniref:14069_t:CDS:1 n=1 Tax=Dentiscutata heterogama TaxID=1316150 RepID=A0ACA9KXX6_9GLOM|nr:14069_t:CDS:2 [Dentiscutata heterogama]
MDNDDEGGYDPRDFVYSQSSDSGSDDEMINLKIKNSKYREYQAPGSNLTSRNVNNTANQKEFTTEYYNNEDDNSMDSFCHKLQKLDVDTSQYTLSFSKLLSTPTPNIPSDYSDSADEHLKTAQNYSRSRFTCIRLADSFSTSAKCINSYSQSLPASMSVENNTLHSIENPLQLGCNHPECNKALQHNITSSSNSYLDMNQSTNAHSYQLRHLHSTLSKPLIDPITKHPSKTLSSYSHQKKSLKNQQIKNTIPTRSNPKRTSTIILPSYENIQKVKRLITCKKTNCGKLFATVSELEVHEQTVHPYKCNYCDARFDKTYYAEKHMHLHNLKFPMECEVPGCGSIFYAKKPYESHLMKHQKKVEKMHLRIKLEETNNSEKIIDQKTKINDERTKIKDKKTKINDEKMKTKDKKTKVNDEKTKMKDKKTNHLRKANTKKLVENDNNERSKVSTNKRSGVNEDNKDFVENGNNERSKVNTNNKNNKRSGVNEDDKGHKINMNNKKFRVSADNESSEVMVDRVVVVITDTYQ